MMERWEMEAERGAWGIHIKHFSNKPSVLEVGGGQPDQLRRKLPQHTMTPTHHQTAVIVISRWCVTLSLLYVGFHQVPPPLTCRIPRGPTLSPSRLLGICFKLFLCSRVSPIKPVAMYCILRTEQGFRSIDALLPTSGQTVYYIMLRPVSVNKFKQKGIHLNISIQLQIKTVYKI